MAKWEYTTLYIAKNGGSGDMIIRFSDETYEGDVRVKEYLNGMGRNDWEIIYAVPIIGSHGGTEGIQMFLKRQSAEV